MSKQKKKAEKDIGLQGLGEQEDWKSWKGWQQQTWYTENFQPMMANYLLLLQKVPAFESHLRVLAMYHVPRYSYDEMMQLALKDSSRLAHVLSGVNPKAWEEINDISAKLIEGVREGTHPLSCRYKGQG